MLIFSSQWHRRKKALGYQHFSCCSCQSTNHTYTNIKTYFFSYPSFIVEEEQTEKIKLSCVFSIYFFMNRLIEYDIFLSFDIVLPTCRFFFLYLCLLDRIQSPCRKKKRKYVTAMKRVNTCTNTISLFFYEVSTGYGFEYFL